MAEEVNNKGAPIDPRQVAALANHLKKLFRERKTLAIRRPYKPSDRVDDSAIWQKAAMHCISMNADPVTFITAAFEKCRMSGGPFPNMLAGPAAMKWYSEYLQTAGITQTANLSGQPVENADRAFEELFEMAFCVLNRRIGHMQLTAASLDVLRDEMVPLHPLVRVLLSCFDEMVLVKFHEEAVRYINENPTMAAAAEKVGFNLNRLRQWTRHPNK